MSNQTIEYRKAQINTLLINDHLRRLALALLDRDDSLSAIVAAVAAAKLDRQGVSVTNLRHEGRLTAELRIAAVAEASKEVA